MGEHREYIPGVCNIGKTEISKRIQAGWLGSVATVLLWVLMAYFQISAPWRLLLFFPALLGALGFIQTRMHFCAAFGIIGIFNVMNAPGKTESIEQVEFRKQDRRKALHIIIYTILIASGIALAGYFL